MPKTKKKAAGGARGGRGGRRPGSWTLVNPEVLRGWREKHKMSRAHVASTLGVSSTSVQNWETGHAVATTKMQQKLAELLKAEPTTSGTVPTNRPPAPPNGVAPSSHDHPALVQATAAIVVEAIRAGGGKNVSARELGVLVRTVRDALA